MKTIVEGTAEEIDNRITFEICMLILGVFIIYTWLFLFNTIYGMTHHFFGNALFYNVTILSVGFFVIFIAVLYLYTKIKTEYREVVGVI